MPVAVVMVASMVASGVSMVKQNQLAKQSANDAQAVADYNSRVDLADAKQVEFDADANTRAARDESRVYGSRQEAAYAASGVLNTGSALAVQAETAGRNEQRILQDRQNAGRQAAQREASARMGVMVGDATAAGIRGQAQANLWTGGASLLRTAAGAYQSGMFSSAGGGGGANTRAGMLAAGAPAGLAARSGIGDK